MNGQRLHPALRALAARNLRVDWLTVEIADAFAHEGIESIVLKGPALADWLYPGEIRVYGDSDVMVHPGDWGRAVAALERRGFENYRESLAHPRMESFASTAFVRSHDNVDLHATLAGLEAAPDAVADSLIAGAQPLLIAREMLLIPSRPALLLHVALHAAHHTEGKPIEDLRRALDRAAEEEWGKALELARALDGLAAFASGLRLIPEGEALAARLELDGIRSARHELRRSGVPMAEGLDELLSAGVPARERLATVRRELFPSAEFLRWWTPLARRGPVGLALAYPWRVAWLVAHTPRGLLVRRRVRRRDASGG